MGACGAGPARILHSYDNIWEREIRLAYRQSDFVAASSDEVGPTGTTPTLSGRTSKYETFGLGFPVDYPHALVTGHELVGFARFTVDIE